MNDKKSLSSIKAALYLAMVFVIASCASVTKIDSDNATILDYLTQAEIAQINADIKAPLENTLLSSSEIKMLDVAKGYLIDKVTKDEAVKQLIASETETNKFALDGNQVQILRDVANDYVRFGLQRETVEGQQQVVAMGRPSAFVTYDLEKVAPKSNHLKKALNSHGIPVIAVLGKARIGSTESILTAIKTGVAAMDSLFAQREISYLTGGYKGVNDNVYGYTRIGYERAKDLGTYSLVVMPEAGGADSHKDADAKDMVGMMWGDDTPALAGIADGAMMFAWYGSWSQIEIDTLLYQNKPIVIVNPYQQQDVETVEGKKGSVTSYRDPKVAAKALLDMLPSPVELKQRNGGNVIALPAQDKDVDVVEYFPFPRWSDKLGSKTATSQVVPELPARSQ